MGASSSQFFSVGTFDEKGRVEIGVGLRRLNRIILRAAQFLLKFVCGEAS